MPHRAPRITAPLLLAGLFLSAGPAFAVDKFKVSSADCEMFWLNRHTPVLHYDIVAEREADYDRNPPADYFRDAAARTAEYCDRTSARPQAALGAPRQIRGIWFQSNDGRFKILYDLDRNIVDTSVGVTNLIGDRYAAEQRSAAQHQAQLDDIRARDARAEEIKAAELKARQDKAAAESAREKAFFDRSDLQIARLGIAVSPANFTVVEDVRTNPFHFRKLGLAVVRAQFNRMVTDQIALFGNELAPVFIHVEDVDRFTTSGETVMLAFRVIDRGDVERSYGSLPEIIVSAMKSEPIFGDYVGAYTCPGGDCGHIFDAPPPT